MDERAYRRAITRAIGKVQKKVNRLRAKCFYPDCQLDAIASHSQQKSGQLRAIAENGQVLAIRRNHYAFLKNLSGNQSLTPIGISEASTFKGFCPKHDKEVFDSIESQPLDRTNSAQAFGFFVRAFSYEFAVKRRMFEWSGLFLDEVRGFMDQDLFSDFEAMRDGNAVFFSHDAPYYMDFIFGPLKNNDYSQLTTEWKVVEKNLGVSSCCVFSPLLAEHERHMESAWGTSQPMVAFNLVPSKTTTHVITSWLPNSDCYCDWVRQETSSKEGLELFINRCAFAESEDTCIRPSLWHSLPEGLRRNVEIAMTPEHTRGQLKAIPRVVTL
jgi:hypothetical protein